MNLRTITLQIGNSDDRLPQVKWCDYCTRPRVSWCASSRIASTSLAIHRGARRGRMRAGSLRNRDRRRRGVDGATECDAEAVQSGLHRLDGGGDSFSLVGAKTHKQRKDKTMAKTLTMRLPDRVYEALVKVGEEWEQDPASWLRMQLIMAGSQPGGNAEA